MIWIGDNYWKDFFDWPNWTVQKGVWVDPDRYDIVEKPEYRQKLIKDKEDEIKRLEELHQERRDRLLKEIGALKGQKELIT